MSDKEINDEMNSEEYLKKYLDETDTSSNSHSNEPMEIEESEDVNSNRRASDLKYMTVDIETLPLGMFYPKGTKIKIRACEVKEIQAYSMVEEGNFADVVDKMNNMLSACIRIEYANGKTGTYLDIKDGDRYYLIFLIREFTFQKGNVLTVKEDCDCGEEVTIPLTRQHFEFYEIEKSIASYFNKQDGKFIFETVNGSKFKIGVPSIGLQRTFTSKIQKDYKENKKLPNLSFLKIVPFTISHLNRCEDKFIDEKLKEFEQIHKDDFQFLNSVIDKMKFGIKKLVNKCDKCGTEVRTDMRFPTGAAGIFVVPDAFEKFIKK